MKKDPKNCPYCSTEPITMGLSPDGWRELKERHDREHTKLSELDNEFDEKFGVDEASAGCDGCRVNARIRSEHKQFARKCYEAGKVDEREAMRKLVEEMPSDCIAQEQLLITTKEQASGMMQGWQQAKMFIISKLK